MTIQDLNWLKDIGEKMLNDAYGGDYYAVFATQQLTVEQIAKRFQHNFYPSLRFNVEEAKTWSARTLYVRLCTIVGCSRVVEFCTGNLILEEASRE